MWISRIWRSLLKSTRRRRLSSLLQLVKLIANIYVSMLKNLVKLRAKRGLSQRALAKLSGISYVHIARMETGDHDPRLSTLKALAKALKVTIGDLVQ